MSWKYPNLNSDNLNTCNEEYQLCDVTFTSLTSTYINYTWSRASQTFSEFQWVQTKCGINWLKMKIEKKKKKKKIDRLVCISLKLLSEKLDSKIIMLIINYMQRPFYATNIKYPPHSLYKMDTKQKWNPNS